MSLGKNHDLIHHGLLVAILCLAFPALSCNSSVGIDSGNSGATIEANPDGIKSPTAPFPLENPFNRRSALFANVCDVSYYDGNTLFKDLFKYFDKWVDNTYQTPLWLVLREDGWPASIGVGQQVTAILQHDGNQNMKAGEYRVMFEGDGMFDIGLASPNPSIATLSFISQNERSFQVQPSNHLHVTIRSTNPNNPLRNMRIVHIDDRPTFEKQPFREEALAVLRYFAGLRFLGWSGENELPQIVTWEQSRPSPIGYQLKDAIDLANILDAMPWFVIPHAANDGYVTGLVGLIKANLKESLRFYLEYSNETWNYAYPQAPYVVTQGQNLGFGVNGWVAGAQYTAHRAAQISEIARSIIGNRPFHMVLAGQITTNRNQLGMTYLSSIGKAHLIDRLAIQNYNGHALGTTPTQTLAMNEDQIINWLIADVTASTGGIIAESNLAAQYGLKLLAYEGGQHLVGVGAAMNNQLLTNLFVATNRHPRMAEYYTALYQNWFSVPGVEYFSHNTDVSRYNQYGSWGLLENYNAPINGKALATFHFLTNSPRSWD